MKSALSANSTATLSGYADLYRGKRVLVTGHTGFKGSWLSLWLSHLGAEVIGYSTEPPTTPSHFIVCGLETKVTDLRGDLLEFEALRSVFTEYRPEIVFHLAAQPIVRQAYEQPRETFLVNVMGTVNVLEAARQTDSVRTLLVVTSDKCYRNAEWDWPYREIDQLGGFEPYGASKACAELAAAVYQDPQFQEVANAGHTFSVVTARAGNVIGGGDWARDRIVTDIVHAIHAGRPLHLRYPRATRPWQHVLDALSGYLSLVAAVETAPTSFGGAWNFGPVTSVSLDVETFVRSFLQRWPAPATEILIDAAGAAGEHRVLQLDSSKAVSRLGWEPAWDIDRTIEASVQWYRAYECNRDADMYDLSSSQIAEYTETAKSRGIAWSTGCAASGRSKSEAR
ncbi:MAG: CDP-glucose 4,6-dehydratase [Planctomycetaceae bacterium]|nr:CDP-glucose 4,6-dehydratase [Planctomycetaceae bacterium]